MQVGEDSKFQVSANKYSANNNNAVGLVGASRLQQSSLASIYSNHLRSEEIPLASTPKVQYFGPNCLLIVYQEKDIATLLDEHFVKSLSGSNTDSRSSYRSFPPSFWNKNYYRNPRNNLSSMSIANAGPSGSSFSYYPDPYSSLLRPNPSSLWSHYPGTSTQPPSNSLDLSDVYYDSKRLHTNDTHSYNHLIGIGRSTAVHIPAPPQYSTNRGDWPVFAASSDYSSSINSYRLESGAESTTNSQVAHTDSSQMKDQPFWFPIA